MSQVKTKKDPVETHRNKLNGNITRFYRNWSH